MNTDQVFGLVTALSVLAGIYCGNLANDHIYIRGGKTTLAVAGTVFLLGASGFIAGCIWGSPVLVGLGIFLFAFEYSWAHSRQVDRIDRDGQYRGT